MKSNLQLQERVAEALAWDPSVDASRIGVAASGGVVTLTGQVPSFVDRMTAERIAKKVTGVKALANDLEIRLPGTSERTDADLAAAAIRALEWDAQVPHQSLQVRVSGSRLTLEGKVQWQFQREAAERAVRNLLGVRGVTNLITLVPSVAPVDVKNRIEAALKRNAELEARNIRVTTRGTTVVLDGKVHSWTERGDAERAAWAAPGVTDVVDHLMVSV